MLENIKNIHDLQKLDVKQLPQLCQEIRQKLVEDVSRNGGHLASNLGVVELSVALHYVFGDDDKIVWDVGHQSYVHKILTSRGENFCTLRKKDGLCGFPDSLESDRDSFGTGHAGTAISAALGLAKARDVAGQNHNVVAVVGDGAMTCGTTYEALNNIGKTKMLIILNDNNMSISDNVGSATRNMSKMRVGKYDKNKRKLKAFLHKIPLIGKPIYKFLRWCKRRAKLGFVRNSYFDTFNLKYIGIIDGNEIKDLVSYLKNIRDNVDKPTVLHIITKKGKGYAPAEQDPIKYHAVPVGGFAEDTVDGAEQLTDVQQASIESSTIVGQILCHLASQNDKIVAISAAMTNAVGLKDFSTSYPDRFFDVGIAEEHAVTFSAGLAKGGARPFVCIYSTFMQRAYDQILHDIAIQNLPVTLLLDRAGFVGEDGKTHQGLFDLSYLGNIPNLKIWTPATAMQLQQMIEKSLTEQGPVAIRYPRTLPTDNLQLNEGWNVFGSADAKVKLLCVGPRILQNAINLQGNDVQVVNVTTVKPLDDNYLATINADDTVVTIEENVLLGGFGSSVASVLSAVGCKVISLGVDDKFVAHATVDEQLKQFVLDEQSLQLFVSKLL